MSILANLSCAICVNKQLWCYERTNNANCTLCFFAKWYLNCTQRLLYVHTKAQEPQGAFILSVQYYSIFCVKIACPENLFYPLPIQKQFQCWFEPIHRFYNTINLQVFFQSLNSLTALGSNSSTFQKSRSQLQNALR